MNLNKVAKNIIEHDTISLIIIFVLFIVIPYLVLEMKSEKFKLYTMKHKYLLFMFLLLIVIPIFIIDIKSLNLVIVFLLLILMPIFIINYIIENFSENKQFSTMNKYIFEATIYISYFVVIYLIYLEYNEN